MYVTRARPQNALHLSSYIIVLICWQFDPFTTDNADKAYRQAWAGAGDCQVCIHDASTFIGTVPLRWPIVLRLDYLPASLSGPLLFQCHHWLQHLLLTAAALLTLPAHAYTHTRTHTPSGRRITYTIYIKWYGDCTTIASHCEVVLYEWYRL